MSSLWHNDRYLYSFYNFSIRSQKRKEIFSYYQKLVNLIFLCVSGNLWRFFAFILVLVGISFCRFLVKHILWRGFAGVWLLSAHKYKRGAFFWLIFSGFKGNLLKKGLFYLRVDLREDFLMVLQLIYENYSH